VQAVAERSYHALFRNGSRYGFTIQAVDSEQIRKDKGGIPFLALHEMLGKHGDK